MPETQQKKSGIFNMIKFLDLKSQYLSIKNEIDGIISEVLNSTKFIGGSYVEQFENDFANFNKAEYCTSVGNGTDALEIAIESLNLPQSSEIIVPANSFIASSEAITRSGHKVVFCDCNEKNYTISIDSFKQLITSKTKAVIAVHLYGHPCDMDDIINISRPNGIKIIEDCAQAHDAKYKNKKVGTIGDIGTFSFYPGKNLGAYGDAGAIVTNNKELANKCGMIANHGRIEKYNHEFEGRNSRMDGLQAAILSVKLKHLAKWTQTRIEIAEKYISQLSEIADLVVPNKEEWAKHVYHLFVVRTQNRDKLKSQLNSMDIQTGIHYPISLPKLKAYKYYQGLDTLTANRIDKELLSLPIGDHLGPDEINEVIHAIKRIMK